MNIKDGDDCEGCRANIGGECRLFPPSVIRMSHDDENTRSGWSEPAWGFPPASNRCCYYSNEKLQKEAKAKRAAEDLAHREAMTKEFQEARDKSLRQSVRVMMDEVEKKDEPWKGGGESP